MIAKKYFLIVALSAFLVPSLCYAAELIHTVKNARFRAGPGTAYQVLWEAPKYTPLEYLAKYRKWYVVRDRDGDIGWVHRQVIGKGSAAVVITKKANIRREPNVKSEIKFTVDERYLFKVLEKKGEWYKVVDVEGDEGWVVGKLLWVSR